MNHQKDTPLYVIIAPNLFKLPDEGPWYLAWQPPAWDDDGYFWTREETFFDVLGKYPENNAWPHKFAFESESTARDFAESYSAIRRTNYTIESIPYKRRHCK